MGCEEKEEEDVYDMLWYDIHFCNNVRYIEYILLWEVIITTWLFYSEFYFLENSCLADRQNNRQNEKVLISQCRK